MSTSVLFTEIIWLKQAVLDILQRSTAAFVVVIPLLCLVLVACESWLEILIIHNLNLRVSPHKLRERRTIFLPR